MLNRLFIFISELNANDRHSISAIHYSKLIIKLRTELCTKENRRKPGDSYNLIIANSYNPEIHRPIEYGVIGGPAFSLKTLVRLYEPNRVKFPIPTLAVAAKFQGLTNLLVSIFSFTLVP